jgi:hypothetical protein
MLTRAQAAAVAALAGGPGPIGFVGDADPMDLHTFLSLRVHLGVERVRYCGMSDEVLDIIDGEGVQPEKLMARELSGFDRAHLRVVQALEDPKLLLGPRVSAILLNGKGLEIEALSFRADMMPALFSAALKVASRHSPGRAGVRRRSSRRPSR